MLEERLDDYYYLESDVMTGTVVVEFYKQDDGTFEVVTKLMTVSTLPNYSLRPQTISKDQLISIINKYSDNIVTHEF